MKHIKIIASVLLIVALLSFCGCEKKPDTPGGFPNGGFGGQNAVDVTEYSVVSAEDYLIKDLTDVSASPDYDENAENCYKINLSTIKSEDLSSVTAYSYKNNELRIKAGGVFVLSGTFDGTITVDGIDDRVQIVLNGVTISTTKDQNSAAIVFKKPDNDEAERVLTVKSGTTNTLSDSTGDDADGDGAVIQAKKRSVVVNGSGILNLVCNGEKTCGIKVKKTLVVDGATINVSNAKKSGIKADEKIIIKNSDITVSADGDGIKTDMEPESAEDAEKYSSKIKYGYIYIENSDIDITSGDDGISANSCLYIANSDENLIKIKTNGGAPNKVTENSSDNADGKALKTDGIEFEDTLYTADYEQNYGLVITGGRFEIDSNDDAIHSKGNVIISGGTLNISSGDDGIHAEYLTKITGGNIVINKSYEGIEGATVEILGGNIDVVSTDDGINAANADLGNYAFYILIAGGDIDVDADGDGLDSNGTLKITGGDLRVLGPTDNFNSALDADTGIIITGGNICAVGSSGMVETPSDKSTQCFIVLNLTSAQSKNTTITVENSKGEKVFELTPTKKYQSIILSLNSFKQNESYTVKVDDESFDATLSSIGTTLGKQNNGFMPNFKPNGNQKDMPDDMPENFDPNNMPNGDFNPNDLPDDFDPNNMPSDLPNGFNPENMPDDMPNDFDGGNGFKPDKKPDDVK